jgi:hypothetical protein
MNKEDIALRIAILKARIEACEAEYTLQTKGFMIVDRAELKVLENVYNNL